MDLQKVILILLRNYGMEERSFWVVIMMKQTLCLLGWAEYPFQVK